MATILMITDSYSGLNAFTFEKNRSCPETRRLSSA